MLNPYNISIKVVFRSSHEPTSSTTPTSHKAIISARSILWTTAQTTSHDSINVHFQKLPEIFPIFYHAILQM